MSQTTRILTSLATVTLLMLPVTAAAKPPVLAPPGQSAISQYVEVVPNDMGGTPTRPGGAATGALTSGQRRQLNNLGADGRTLAAAVDATAQPAVSGSAETRADLQVGGSQRRGEPSGGSGVPGGQLSGPGARSTASLLLSAASGGGGGLGVLLPAIMAVALVGAVVRAGRARRTGS